jgi:hypothetical protein
MASIFFIWIALLFWLHGLKSILISREQALCHQSRKIHIELYSLYITFIVAAFFTQPFRFFKKHFCGVCHRKIHFCLLVTDSKNNNWLDSVTTTGKSGLTCSSAISSAFKSPLNANGFLFSMISYEWAVLSRKQEGIMDDNEGKNLCRAQSTPRRTGNLF